ncbi:isochorismatase family protein [Lipomyces oligophaga]|uniref:isochorismatase family protein n=1 Tax=Lipomyces oligophaga TaxID=45792 RepID=UPI0034CDF27C
MPNDSIASSEIPADSNTDCASATAIGPSPSQSWSWNKSFLNLVRPPIAPLPLLLDAKPQRIQIDVNTTALIIVDMQNDFFHPEGWFGQKGRDLELARKPIPAIAGLLKSWRAVNGKVIWLNWGVRNDRANLGPTVQNKGKGGPEGVGYAEISPIDRGPALVQGSWGAEIIDELQAEPTDLLVYKHRLSGFWDNELESILRCQGVSTLLFTGINTDRCVFSSLQDAAFLGYDCILVEDACGTSSPQFVTDAIYFMVRQLHGFTAESSDLIQGLEQIQSK